MADKSMKRDELMAIEGYLASKADKGDKLAASLRKMLLKSLTTPRFHLVRIDDQGVHTEEHATESERLQAIIQHGDTQFSDLVCIDQVGLDFDNVYAAPDPEAAAQELNDLTAPTVAQRDAS